LRDFTLKYKLPKRKTFEKTVELPNQFYNARVWNSDCEWLKRQIKIRFFCLAPEGLKLKVCLFWFVQKLIKKNFKQA